MEKVDIYAKIIWDYMHMGQTLPKADLILCLGSRDMSPAERACDLYLEGYAPIILFSGDCGASKILEKSEADMYKDIAMKRGISSDVVYTENKSRNTGENIQFSKKIIEENNIKCDKIILVQKPYMERRTYATFKKNWPEPEIFVTSPQISYEEYTENSLHDDKDGIINRMVGDLQRIKEYPKLGFQIEQEIPDEVWNAYEALVSMGYNKKLI